ncbi:MAG: cobalamin-dependent protein [Acidobacteriota bacterium]
MQSSGLDQRQNLAMEADLILLHAPSVYDFRDRDDILFAYLSDSDSVNVSAVFEMFPLGFFSIKQRLRAEGIKAEIVNLASLMLQHPRLNVPRLIDRLKAPVFGLDLHWMAHCHGSLEVAQLVRRAHPEALILFGGLSSTYYARELMAYPQVDVVVEGYDTLEPLVRLMSKALRGSRDFREIPNLWYRRADGSVIATGFTHKPARNCNDVTVDWSFYSRSSGSLIVSPAIMTLPNAGCTHDCPWCGGSRFAYQNFMGLKKTVIRKDNRRVIEELATLGEAATRTSIHAMQCYSETADRLGEFLREVGRLKYRALYVEQFDLPNDRMLRKMGASGKTHLLLSPESHDQTISRLSGRGSYSMAELEEWIPRALGQGIASILVWFFIGMPRQTPESVAGTVAYCKRLLEKFRGKPVLPLVCPMVPFLDPGSRFFEEPEKHGYTVLFRSLEDHRKAMVEPLWHRRLNYQTAWMSRKQILDVTYESVRQLTIAKGEAGVLPGSFAARVLSVIDETKRLLQEIETSLERTGGLDGSHRSAIKTYNRDALACSTDQIIPISRPLGGRWFDDFTVPGPLLAELET